MSRECYLCEKRSVMGRSQMHRRGVAGKRWLHRSAVTMRVFKANLQPYSIEENGKNKHVTLCAKCIKRINFDANQNFA